MKNELTDLSLLVVDDNIVNQRVVSMSLRSSIGTIDVAGNGLEAFQKYCENHYDVILMDGRMPVMDGYETTRKIRDYEKESDLDKPSLIIALTGSDTAHETAACLDAGMNACMFKPFRIHEFLEILKEFN
ncbi:response regulator [Sunxiuqinia elliptica]|uniref:CheY chemotaxis protein or a CheY-like REC (Receiver) domain n=1 Tax=Sunxiuqinia elliptica TaxID=655355 RepID=A0A1I2LKU9_9BACT|nr:response regulator [Sunxiuqinia elliptica]SFF80112.1 CheY chemotaxis protein or a CheY-like REC (receiver) domain [Sunxiuqinia elliptica]